MGKRDPKSWTEEQYQEERQRQDKRLEQVKREKEIYNQRLEIHDMRRQMRRWHPPTTTKILMAFIFINCSVVEIYSMAVMYLLQDLSSLYALITAVISESISFAIYAAKAYNETKQEELIKLERDKMEMGISEEDEEPDREGAMG
ncbi:MAG: hypothetical protein LUC83_03075 [Clostridiales bacterium]|nr:hypothetical protein [Clostridiales bacterium]